MSGGTDKKVKLKLLRWLNLLS